MLAAQRRYGGINVQASAFGSVKLGRALFPLVPEDEFDTGPIFCRDSRLAMVGDVRLDNREELLSALDRPLYEPLSDAHLLFLAYRQWGESAFDRLVGDYAMAFWNERENCLQLVRDPVGQRPLHYHVGDGFVAFASMPQGLRVLPAIPDELDQLHLAAFAADIPRVGAGTYFAGIRRVQPGHVVTVDREKCRERRHWQMPNRELNYSNDRDYEEGLRDLLDEAVRSRLRGVGPLVAAHMSAGLDSSSVAATAARLQADRGGRVLAMTSVPRAGFAGPIPPGRIGDEGPLAGQVAALYPNMRHHLVRRGAATPLDRLGTDALYFQEPIGHPCNQVWLSGAARLAQEQGARTLFTGETGNLGLSAGSVTLLADLVGAGSMGRWMAEARALTRRGTMRWRGVLVTSFGPWLPMPLWRALARIGTGHSGRSEGFALLPASLRDALDGEAQARARGGRPEHDNRALRFRLLGELDPGNFRKGGLGAWGLDERDPTSDRRLIEFCLALPVDQLLRDGVSRSLARRALADRLPPGVLNGVRGYQFADWYESLSAPALLREIANLRASPAASALLDLDRAEWLARSWPEGGWSSGAVLSTYRIGLLRALSAAHFAAAIEAESVGPLASGAP